MPLSKAKQVEYQRERRKRLGMTKQIIIPSVIPSTSITPRPTQQAPRLGHDDRLLVARQVVAGVESRTFIPRDIVWYQGLKRIETTTRETDADGNIIPEF